MITNWNYFKPIFEALSIQEQNRDDSLIILKKNKTNFSGR